MKTLFSHLVLATLWALLFAQHSLAAAEFTGLGQPNASGSQANDVSDNGEVRVGSVLVNEVQKASRWSALEGLVLLGDLAFGESFATAVSADGQVIVGRAFNGTTMEAFRWTSATGMVGLGELSGDGSTPLDVSDDGNTVVGFDGVQAQCRNINDCFGSQLAFVWRSGSTMQQLPSRLGCKQQRKPDHKF